MKSSGEIPSNLTKSGDGVERPLVRLLILARKSFVPLNWKTGVLSSLISLSLKEKNPEYVPESTEVFKLTVLDQLDIYLVAASSSKLAYVTMITSLIKKKPLGTVQWLATA